MVNKQNLWFVTLFSIILILSIFYISINEDEIKTLAKTDVQEVDTNDTTLVVSENTELVALRIQSDEENLLAMNELKEILLSETANIEEKNDAYNSLLTMSKNNSLEGELEDKINKEYQIESFVKIKNNNITVVLNKKDHNYEIANKIIRKVQESFDEYKYITVKFN